MRSLMVCCIALGLVSVLGCGGGDEAPTPPVAVDDTFDVVGNVQLSRGASAGLVLPNDFDANGDPLTVTAFDAVSVNGGDVNVNPDGSFTYEPPLGFEGVDSFTYTIQDTTGLQSTATVTLTVSDVVWFIDAAAGGGGDGRFTSPFNTLAAFSVVQGGGLDREPEAGDTIFLYEAGGATYDGAVALLDAQELIGQGVSLEIDGMTIVGATTNARIRSVAGTTVTLASDNTIRGLDVVSLAGGGVSGAGAGNLRVDATSVDATGGPALSINGGTLTIDLDAVTSDLSPSSGVSLQGCSGTFLVSGTCAVFTPSASGIDVQNCACDVTFTDVSITDADQHGISLAGSSGAFVCNGGLIDNPDDMGMLCLMLTGSVTLQDLVIQNTGDGAVDGQESHGLKCDDCTGDIRVTRCTFSDMNETPTGAGSALDNNGIYVDDRDGGTLGSLQILECTFSGLVVANIGTTTDHGIKIVLDNDSDITDCDVTGCIASGLGRSFCEVNCDLDDDSDACDIGDLNISDNGSIVFPIEAAAACIELRVGGTSDCTFHIDNNVLSDSTNGHSAGNGIRVNSGEFGVGTVSTATITGTISGNDIDDLGDGGIDNGIELQVQEDTTAIVAIDNNTVDGQSDNGIRCRVFDDADCDLTISNNSIGSTTPNTNAGIEVQTRSQITALTLCLDIFNNICAVGDPYELNQDAGTFSLLDIAGVIGGASPWTATEVDTYLGSSGVNRNNIGTKSTQAGVYTNCVAVQTP